MQKVHRTGFSRVRLYVSILFQDSFHSLRRGFFSPFLHSTCSLSVSYAYVGLEGGSPIFKQFNVLLLMIMKGIIQDFYLLWSMYSNMFFNFINICLIRVLSPILTESRLISFPRSYLDVSIHFVSFLMWFSTVGICT